MGRRDRRWKWQALHRAVTWWLKMSVESMITPRLVIWSEILISASAILIDGMVGKVRRRWWVPKSIASDLSGLRQRPLKQSQDRKADRHASKRPTDLVVSLRVRPIYSCASSAYCWWEMPWSETICPTGEIYSEKSRGPRLTDDMSYILLTVMFGEIEIRVDCYAKQPLL